MDKPQADRLNADAPAWLQAAVFGLFTASAAAMAVLALSFWLLPDEVSSLIPWLALAVVLVLYGGYVVWATPRVRILRVYGEVLARVLDEPINVARNRVWGARGPGWRMVGLAILVPLLALTIPAMLLLVASMSSVTSTAWDEASGGGAAFSPVGWLLVAMSVGLIAAIGWLAHRMTKRNETIRLLSEAAQDDEHSEALVEQAVELTHGVFPRSTASWIGGAAFYSWAGAYTFGRLADTFSLGRTSEVLLWVLLSTAVAIIAIRQARLAGAPAVVWTGVVLWVLAGTILGGLVYAGLWDVFGSLLIEEDAGGWLGLLADVPFVLAAWVTAVRTEPTSGPPA